MKTPKMLPWLAHKAGITDARAEALWAEALEYAATSALDAQPGASDKAAVTRLLMLIEAEEQAMRRPQEQKESSQTRGRWPYSLMVAMKPKAEETLAVATAS